MAFAIYKPGQGYWTRMLSAIGAGTLVLAGVAWMIGQLGAVENAVVVQSVLAVAIIAVFGGLVFWLLNKPRVADFMIATEAEMKKVNWPSRREIIGSTWIVICGTFMLVALLFIIDVIFGWFFLQIDVLHT